MPLILKQMDLSVENHILNEKQEKAIINNPELVSGVYIEPNTGKIYFVHDFFMEPVCAGVLPNAIIPMLTKIEFFVKSWRIEKGKKIYINLSISKSLNNGN